jgi:hypothetical protein
MNESYTIGGSPEDFKKFVDSIPITAEDTKAELLAQIVGELIIMNGTLGKIERALTGGVDG